MFPKISTKKDGTGHANAFPDVCKVPAPPAPFAPVPYPNMHANKLEGAKKVVIETVKLATKNPDVASDAVKKKGLDALKSMEKLLAKHASDLKQAPKLEYEKAKKLQATFEKALETQAKVLTKAFAGDPELKKRAKAVVEQAGKAARCN